MLLFLVLAALAALWMPHPASAQAVYGSIFGTITDPQGAAVPNAKITVTETRKAISSSANSNETGNYTVTHLIPGVYSVRAESQGFKVFQANDIQVFADAAARVDIQLQVGATGETVNVSAEEVPLVKTDRADVSTIFTGKIAELPIFNRNFTALQLITPGTQRLMWQHASSENPQGSIQIMVDGQHFSGTSFQLDGTDNRDPILGIIVINPNLEGVTQTKITTQNYDAEFGQALAAVVTAQTKSGTNDYHGSAFWYRRSDATQARNPFTQSTKNALTGRFLPPELWNQFGGAFGGPIAKNKLFFFGDYQATRSKVGASNLLTVPTALVRSTCLAGLACNLSEYTNQIYDPATGPPGSRTPFAGNIIPANRISPQAVALLKLLPAPTGPGVQDNFVASGSGIFNTDGFDVRIDHQTTDKLHLFGRYSLQQFTQSASGSYGLITGGKGFGVDGFAGQSKTRNQSLATGFDYALSPTLLTDFRVGFYKYRVNVSPNGVGTTPAKDAGIPGLNLGDTFTSGMPEIQIAGLSGFDKAGEIRFGYSLGVNRCNCPLLENEWQLQFVNNWTKIVGNHSYKFGADIRHANNLRVPSDAHRSGQLQFNNDRTQGPTGGGLGLATFLLGDVTNFERYVSTVTNAGETQKRWFFYGQDTYRATPKLTLNYGLRWELYFPQKVTIKGGGGWVDLSTGLVRVGGVGPINRQGNVDMSYRNFAPRLGLAYQFTPKTVVRMGYGRSFDIGVFGSIFGHSVTQNLPVLTRQQLKGANNFDTAFTLATGPTAAVFPAPDPTTGTFPLPDGNNAFIQTERMRMPTVDAWNVTIQREITPTASAQVGYVGNKGTHVFAGNGPDYNCNQARIEGFGTLTTNQRRRFFPLFGWSQDLRCHLNDASNNYHSLQTKFEKRFSHGYELLAHYTWAKGLNYDGDYYTNNPRVNYGPNDFDRRHVFVLTNLWELPFGRGRRFAGSVSRAADYLIGGWSINTSWNWSSGLPFNVSYNSCGSDRDTGPCRPDLVGSVSTGGSRAHWFTTSGTTNLANGQTAGPWRRPAKGTFGSLGRNAFYGPSYFNTDLSLSKRFLFTERINTQFRMDVYNLFNHVQLGNPNTCIDCNLTDDGKITNIAPGAQMRQLQFGLRVEF